MSVTQEMLIAFLDGSLLSADRERVREMLYSDPRVSKQLIQPILLNDAARESFADDLKEPVPDTWLAMIDAATLGAETGKVQSLAAHRHRRNARSSRWPLGAAIAASVAFALYLGKGPTPATLIEDQNGTLVATAELAEALNVARSGVPLQFASRRKLDVQLSMRTGPGGYCREAILQGPDLVSAHHVLACKAEGAWQIAAVAQASARQGGYETVSSDRPLDAIVASIDGEALDSGAETVAIRKKWQDGAASK